MEDRPMSTNGSTNGRARLDDGKVRVAIIGVGNCANSLLQGVEYYKDAPDDQFVPGLMHVNLGGYHVRDVEFTAAFDVVMNYLPVGSEAATKWYAEQILEAGCAMVNCMPVFIAREDYWGKRFAEKGLPIIGDDIKSQVGATITHRVLTSLFRERGVHL